MPLPNWHTGVPLGTIGAWTNCLCYISLWPFGVNNAGSAFFLSVAFRFEKESSTSALVSRGKAKPHVLLDIVYVYMNCALVQYLLFFIFFFTALHTQRERDNRTARTCLSVYLSVCQRVHYRLYVCPSVFRLYDKCMHESCTKRNRLPHRPFQSFSKPQSPSIRELCAVRDVVRLFLDKNINRIFMHALLMVPEGIQITFFCKRGLSPSVKKCYFYSWGHQLKVWVQKSPI